MLLSIKLIKFIYLVGRFTVTVCFASYVTADSEHCFDLSSFIRAVSVTDIYPMPYMLEEEFFALCQLQEPASKLSAKAVRPRKRVFFSGSCYSTGIVTSHKQKNSFQAYKALSLCRSLQFS